MNLRKFFAELKRRNVYKVAIAYAVVAWLLMQTATQVFSFPRESKLGDPAGLHRRTDQLTPINRWLLLAKLIAQSHGLQRALTPGPIPCLFCDR
jgi:hypothetical protein